MPPYFHLAAYAPLLRSIRLEEEVTEQIVPLFALVESFAVEYALP